MKYYIIAGEASGDLHGSHLMTELLHLNPSAEMRCWGGDLMRAAGGLVVKDYRDLAFMGFLEIAKNLPTILKNIRFCKKDILSFGPDALILIDYPGFNLRIASWAKKQGLRVIYYISPQVWAWKESRVKLIRKSVDKMLVILPFEKAFYQKWDYEVDYVGHPLVEEIEQFSSPAGLSFVTLGGSSPRPAPLPLIALLPGSRKQEISTKLPVMLEMVKRFPQFQFVVALAPGLDRTFYADMLDPYPGVLAVQGQTYALLSQSKAACVTSGTATLETALFGVPEVVCYKGSEFSYQIAKRLIRVKYISLVNLIMDRLVVKELIQHDFSVDNLERALREILLDQNLIVRIKEDYSALKSILSGGGNASANAAQRIVEFLKTNAS